MSIVKRLDHLSIGVADMAAARKFVVEIMGAEPLSDAGASPEGFDWATFRLGGRKIEFVSPHVPGEGGVGRYLAKNGEGYHHASMSVANLDEAIAHFESRGIRILGVNRDTPNFKHFYLHPKDTFGAMIQIFEENDETLSMA